MNLKRIIDKCERMKAYAMRVAQRKPKEEFVVPKEWPREWSKDWSMKRMRRLPLSFLRECFRLPPENK